MGEDQLLSPIDISLICKEALKLLRASLPTTIEIRQHIERCVALAEATQIHQVIVNLCTNAAQAMGDKGLLDVSLNTVELGSEDLRMLPGLTLAPGPYLRLRVADSGHGMDAQTMQRIFEPYFTTKETGKGTGLGLAVVHGIVKRHGGEIHVRSHPAEGSVFDVYLPPAKLGSRVPIAASESLPTGTERILIVDDEAMIAEMGARMLAKLGYRMTAKTSSSEALHLFRCHPEDFDLVITDFTMPEMTGIELAGEMRKVKPQIPIILCTGFSDKVSETAVAELGRAEFAMKPLGVGSLARLVRSILDGE
ncbi:MAG: ATP-binding protein, partial [Acidobacteriota bacterium]